MARPAILLDRDGTLIRDVGYPSDPRLVELLPGVAEALRRLQDQGYALAIVSNQSGVGRGFFTQAEAAAVHARLVEVLAAEGVTLEGAYYCFHGPDEGCDCRKPLPGLVLKAAEELDVDLPASYVVGDGERDIEAGRRVGTRSILLHPGGAVETAADATASDWSEVLRTIDKERTDTART